MYRIINKEIVEDPYSSSMHRSQQLTNSKIMISRCQIDLFNLIFQ